jgi:hypothetical protein
MNKFGARPRSEVFADLMKLFLGKHAKLLLEQDAKQERSMKNENQLSRNSRP